MSIRKFLPAGLVATVTIFIAGVVAPALAQVQPSIQGGDIYRVRNLTKGTGFMDPGSADKCDELQYRVRIHNGGPEQALQNVVVKAVIPSNASTQNVSTVTVSASNASPGSTSDTATVNLSQSLRVTYVPGSSQLLNSSGGVISSIGDVTGGAGVNIGNVGVSLNETRFVQFKAKIDCPKPPEQPRKPPEQPKPQPPKPQPPVVQQQQQQQQQSQQQTTVVTGGRGGGGGSGPAPTATELPAAGPADTAAIVGLVSTLSSAGYYLVSRRFN